MRSSYIQNNYAEVFAAIIDAFKPRTCVELGVLDGYSAVAIGQALKKNGHGLLHAYDLFDSYPYKHGEMAEVLDVLIKAGLTDVTLTKQDAKTVHLVYGPNSVDFLHVDLSNDGETVRQIMNDWHNRMVVGGIICFEGGTAERDQVEWMVQYNRPSIKKEMETNPTILGNYIFGTYLKFPGLTMLLRKR